jgi:uncharacterized protein YggE
MAGHRIVTRIRAVAGVAAVAACVGGCMPAHALPANGAAGAHPSPTANTASADTATISVGASAQVSVTPDRARLVFAIETRAENAAAATSSNADLTSRAIAAVREAAGASAELSTERFRVSPEYTRPDRDQPPRISAYAAVNALVVVLDAPGEVGRVIDAAVGAGANRIESLSFFASDTRQAYLAALEQAVERAMAEAQVMARASGGSLGRVVSLSSNAVGQPAVAAFEMQAMARADTPIEVGDQTVGASVRLQIQLLGR